MTEDDLDALLADCPRLYHVAMRESWPMIRRHGLLPTDGLLDLFRVDAALRETLTTRRRPAAVPLDHPDIGRVVIRDQIPLLDSHLARCLTGGLTPRDWHARLNERVFFWLSESRLERLLCAGAYRGNAHAVLTLDARALVRDYRARIELAPINTGATRPFPQPRGPETFLPIARYPYTEWRARRGRREAVVELTVVGGVPNVRDYVETVCVRRCGAHVATLYRRPAD